MSPCCTKTGHDLLQSGLFAVARRHRRRQGTADLPRLDRAHAGDGRYVPDGLRLAPGLNASIVAEVHTTAPRLRDAFGLSRCLGSGLPLAAQTVGDRVHHGGDQLVELAPSAGFLSGHAASCC
jgi:hypothetical protein